jgi:hypothetical protein
MQKAGFLSLLLRGFRNTALPAAGAYALIIAVASLSGGVTTVTLAPFWLGTIGAVILFLVCTFAASARIAFRMNQSASPRVRVARQMRGANTHVICLLDTSPMFAMGMAVSFFDTDQNGFEVQIGIGEVVSIQENGFIQVALVLPTSGYEDVVNKIANNEKGTLETIRVKPFVSAARYLEANR